MNEHEKLNYVEFPSRDLDATKTFFSDVFEWVFTDYGSEYAAFSNAGMEGGFYAADSAADSASGSALLVFYSADIAATQQKVEAAGGQVCTALFDFPGGRRFHFREPSGNEFAVWSE